MSNLATMIMEGASYGAAHLTHSYGHEDGAGLIAMESAEALRDIFEATFYIPNSYALESAIGGGSGEYTMESVGEKIKGAFTAVKNFFIKLKNKVLELLHNIKRFLKGVFGNHVKWVNDYKSELEALTDEDLKGYDAKLYKYKFEEVKKLKVADMAASLEKDGRELLEITTDKLIPDNYEELIDEKFEGKYEDFIKAFADGSEDTLEKDAWSMVRGNATSENDKETVNINKSKISEFIKVVSNSEKELSMFDNFVTGTNTAYTKHINFVSTCERYVSNFKYVEGNDNTLDGKKAGLQHDKYIYKGQQERYASLLRKYSQYVSKQQTALNKVFNINKTALQERANEYTKVLRGAFGYARKNRKKSK